MQQFIHRLNIEHYEKLLQTVTAEADRSAFSGCSRKRKEVRFGQLAREKEKAGIARFTLPANEAKHRTGNKSTHQGLRLPMPSVCRRRIDLPIRSQNLSTAENMCKARCPS